MSRNNRQLVTVAEQPSNLAVVQPGEVTVSTAPTRPLRRRLSDPPDDITEHDLKRLELAKHQAVNLEELTAAAYLQPLGEKYFGDAFDPAAYQAFRDKYVRDAGDTTDPIEQMLLEQAMLCHHHIGHLHKRALEANTPEAAKVFYGALARLQGESRRLALAIRMYRTPVQPKRFTVVKQQNIAAGDQQVALMGSDSIPSNKVTKSFDDTQLVSNRQIAGMIQHEPSYSSPAAESETCSGWPNQPCQAGTVDAGGA